MASKLLEACETALWYYETFRDKSPIGATEADDIASVRAAIAIAKGGLSDARSTSDTSDATASGDRAARDESGGS